MVHLTYGGHFLQKASVTSPEYCPSAWKCQVSYTPLDRCLWISPILALSVLSVTESLRTIWLASDFNRCWCEAGYQLLATYTRQQCLYPWYHCGANAEMVVGEYVEVWCVPSASHVPCIDRSHSYILTWECLLPYFLKVLCTYIVVWAGEFLITGCSEWWGFCVICW